MNLQLHLLSRIVAVALLCLLAIAAYALYQSHAQAERTSQQLAQSAAKQLESQLLRINAGIGLNNPFPDFEFWKQTGAQPGICLLYAPADNSLSRSLCHGTKPAEVDWPTVFERYYRQLFQPGLPVLHTIELCGSTYGTLTLTPSAELEIAQAWKQTLSLLTLSSVTVFAVCLLVYLSIRRALQPAQAIVSGLAQMESGHLAYRLPAFELNEWQRLATAINQLAGSQQQLLEERQGLVVKLIQLQEQERRYLARELHDEFGQCLTAINAVATSIKQTASQQCPEVITEAEQIKRIVEQMLKTVRDLLSRLHPAEFDELGLAASLNSLIAGWNGRSGSKTRYQLSINGDCARLTEAQAVALFRIAQECLTNIAKHAQASKVDIQLTVTAEAVVLSIADDGIARQLPFTDGVGIGLLGIRERLTGLRGQLQLAIAQPHGLIVKAWLPMTDISELKP